MPRPIPLAFRYALAGFCLIAILSGQSFAQWTLEVKNLRMGPNNTRIYLGYQKEEEQARNFVADITVRPLRLEATYRLQRIDIRPKGRSETPIILENKQMVGDFHLDPAALAPVLLRKEVELSSRGSEIFIQDIRLPVDQQYQIDVDISEPATGEHILVSLKEPFLVHGKLRLQTSDLFLSFDGTERSLMQEPVLKKVIDVDQPYIHYGVYLYARDYEVLRIRAILAREKTDEEGGGSTQTFESIQQTNRVIYPEGKSKFLFRDTLDLRDLAPSTYTIWVLVEAGGEEKLERARFVKGGDINKRIYDQLERSIKMMVHISPPSLISEILGKETPGERQIKFDDAWETLYGEEAQEEMQTYYQKVFRADSLFAEEGREGWQTDRGRIFVLYGDPKEEEVNIRDKAYLRWVYPRWSLSFLFEENQGKWELID